MFALRSAKCAFVFLLWATLVPLSASAVPFNLALEPGVGIPLSPPQTRYYGPGFGASVKGLFGLTPFLDLGPTISVMALPSTTRGGGAGVAWALGGGIRLKRPHTEKTFFGLSPWIDADIYYVRTGPLNRPGFDVGLGVSVPIDRKRMFWIGPFVRYFHIAQLDRAGFDNRDSKSLIVGLSFEVDTGTKRAALANERCPEACSDQDGDGISDAMDSCPEAKGTMENWGCPLYSRLIVKRDRLELKEKLYFGWDEATIDPASYATLDDVVQALNDNKNFQVQIEGHSDSSGPNDHNQTLSEKRAEAVLTYLAEHGVAPERLSSKGFSSSDPRDTNTTAEGRENNRRVEFVVYFTLKKDGSTK